MQGGKVGEGRGRSPFRRSRNTQAEPASAAAGGWGCAPVPAPCRKKAARQGGGGSGGHFRPEVREGGAAGLVTLDGEGGKAGPGGDCPGEGEPAGEPGDHPGEEGVPGAGGVHHFHPVGGAVAGLSGDAVVIDAAGGAEGDDHAAQAQPTAVVQDGIHGGFEVVAGDGVVQQPFGFDIIADEAAGMAQQVGAAQDDAHIGGDAVEVLFVLLAQCHDLLADVLPHIHFEADAIRTGDDLIAPFRKVFCQRLGIGHLAGAAGEVAVFIHDGEPHTDAVLRHEDAVGEVDMLRLQPFHRLAAHGGGVPLGDEGDGGADAGHVLGDIAGDAAVDEADAAQIGADGVVLPEGEAFDIDEDDAHDDGAWHSGVTSLGGGMVGAAGVQWGRGAPQGRRRGGRRRGGPGGPVLPPPAGGGSPAGR